MQVLGVIPARFASTRFPGKPLALIHGKPMIQWVYERSAGARGLDRLVVATDSLEIQATVLSFGGECVLTSPDHPSGTDRVAEAARAAGLHGADIVVNIQGDEPLVEPAMIELLADGLKSAPRCPMATLVFESSSRSEFEDPNVVKAVVNGDWEALYFSRAPIPFRRGASPNGPLRFLKHLGFYAYRHAFLGVFTGTAPGKLEEMEKLEQLRALENGYAIKVILSPFESISVDTPEDIEKIAAPPSARRRK
jgi:3-deoxy-manno-octulosonate cytidylyltransferase (CMP-KDO synthetase)